MGKTIVKAQDPYRWNASNWNTKAEWRKWERVGMARDLTLNELWLDWVDERVVDLEILGAIESIQFDRTIEGASTITLILRDPHNHLFNFWAGRARERIFNAKKMVPIDDAWVPINATDVIERAVDVILDGVHFRLVKVNYNWGQSQISLTFEDRIIYWLRRKKGAIKSSRAQVTRAMFILRLLREIDRKTSRIPFICPELRKPQAIAKAKNADVVTKDPESDKGGFDSGPGLTVKGKKATSEQKRNMDKVLTEAQQCTWKGHKPPPKSLKAVAEAVIVEAEVVNLKGHHDHDSQGILQVRDSTAAPMHINNLDIGDCVRAFMQRGFWGKGGAIQLSVENPHNNAGWVAQNTQGSGVPEAYGKQSDEADEWLKAWNGESGDSGGGSYVKSYQYSRDKDENSWDCMVRLAEEVKWRIFPVGNVMYFMSEDDLYRRRIRHLITPDSPEFVDFTADVDWGKPTNEMEIQVNMGDWDAPPGCCVEFKGFGPVDGRWLVASSTRDWFAPTAALTLHQPGNPDKEPAAERVTRSQKAGEKDGLGKGKSADFYHYAKLVSKNTSSYHLGGGHGNMNSFSSATNFDCSGSTSWALWKAGMWEGGKNDARVSGDFSNWGLPGRGDKITVWYSGGHVFSIFEDGAGVGKKRFDTGGPGGGSGARVRDARRPTSGFRARHWPGT